MLAPKLAALISATRLRTKRQSSSAPHIKMSPNMRRRESLKSRCLDTHAQYPAKTDPADAAAIFGYPERRPRPGLQGGEDLHTRAPSSHCLQDVSCQLHR